MNKSIEKLVVVGGVAGGASTAARARRLSEHTEIVMFERGPHVSFSNCCLPYHLSDMIPEVDDLVLMNPEQFKNEYRIDARVKSEVVKIDRENKEVVVRNVETGEEYREGYDKLVLSPGASPIVPNIEGIEKVNVFTVRNVPDIDRLNLHVKNNGTKHITVIGGGFIGIETAENLRLAGFEVTLVEALPQVMSIFDYDMAQILHRELHDNGIELIVDDAVKAFDEGTVILNSGAEVKTDAVVMAIGVRAETSLAEDAGLEIGETGAIKVDNNFMTIDKDIYAIGDAIEVWHALTHKKVRLPLAGPAQKQARSVADHIFGRVVNNTGVIGSSSVKMFNINGASTGLTEAMIEKSGLPISYDSVYVIPQDMVGLMPDSKPMHFKLIFEVPTGRILGAQAIGRGNVDKRIDVIATAIKFNATLEQLQDLEFCYAPPFGTAKDVVIYAALVGLNILRKEFKQVPVSAVRGLVEEGAMIVDVRNTHEWDEGHIKGAVNIPLCEFRDRLDEIPKDRPVYFHCRSSQRSYNAVRALQQLGYDNVVNIAGSFLGISEHEYFNDIRLNREPIVTEYNFN